MLGLARMTTQNLGFTLPMIEPTVDNDQGSDTDDLRYKLFRTLRDLRAGRITAQEAKAVTNAVTKKLLDLGKRMSKSTH
jgi:hypothetical protein